MGATKDDVRYCDRCGAQIEGDGSWGHDDNCPRATRSPQAPAVLGYFVGLLSNHRPHGWHMPTARHLPLP
jgi:hypothetical protein